jgi:quercetin dioxygenase-like cupin family protein
MRKPLVTLAAIVMLGIAGSLNAQQQTTPVPVPAIKRTVLQKVDVPGSNVEVVLALADFAPDVRTGRHFHPGTVLAYVMDGEFVLTRDGEPQTAFRGGESFQIPHAGIHDEGTNAGAAKLMVVYVVEKGKPLVQPVQ